MPIRFFEDRKLHRHAQTCESLLRESVEIKAHQEVGSTDICKSEDGRRHPPPRRIRCDCETRNKWALCTQFGTVPQFWKVSIASDVATPAATQQKRVELCKCILLSMPRTGNLAGKRSLAITRLRRCTGSRRPEPTAG